MNHRAGGVNLQKLTHNTYKEWSSKKFIKQLLAVNLSENYLVKISGFYLLAGRRYRYDGKCRHQLTQQRYSIVNDD